MIEITGTVLVYDKFSRKAGHWIGNCKNGDSTLRGRDKIPPICDRAYFVGGVGPKHESGLYCEDCVRKLWPHLIW